MKVGDKVVCVSGYRDHIKEGFIGTIEEISSINTLRLVGYGVYDWWDCTRFKVIHEQPNYAAAFNAWMDDYMNNPQAYENSHESAVRHLKEKLNGEEPSYGQIAAQMLIEYLNKLESK